MTTTQNIGARSAPLTSDAVLAADAAEYGVPEHLINFWETDSEVVICVRRWIAACVNGECPEWPLGDGYPRPSHLAGADQASSAALGDPVVTYGGQAVGSEHRPDRGEWTGLPLSAEPDHSASGQDLSDGEALREAGRQFNAESIWLLASDVPTLCNAVRVERLLPFLVAADRADNRSRELLWKPADLAVRTGQSHQSTKDVLKDLAQKGLFEKVTPGQPGRPHLVTFKKVPFNQRRVIPIAALFEQKGPMTPRYGRDTPHIARFLLAVTHSAVWMLKGQRLETELPADAIAYEAGYPVRTYERDLAKARARLGDAPWISFEQTYLDGRRHTCRITIDWRLRPALTAATAVPTKGTRVTSGGAVTSVGTPRSTSVGTPRGSFVGTPGVVLSEVSKETSSSIPGSLPMLTIQSSPEQQPATAPSLGQADDRTDGSNDDITTLQRIISNRHDADRILNDLLADAGGDRTRLTPTGWALLVIANIVHTDERHRLDLTVHDALTLQSALEPMHQKGWDCLALAQWLVTDSGESVTNPVGVLHHRLKARVPAQPQPASERQDAVWLTPRLSAKEKKLQEAWDEQVAMTSMDNYTVHSLWPDSEEY